LAAAKSAARGSTISDSQAQESANYILSPGIPSSFTSSVPTGSIEPSPTASTGGKMSFPNGRIRSISLRRSSPGPTQSIITNPKDEFNAIKTVSASQGPPMIVSQLAKKATIASRLPNTTVAPLVSSTRREKGTIVSGTLATTDTPPLSLMRDQKATFLSGQKATNATPTPSLLHRVKAASALQRPPTTVAPPLPLISREKAAIVSGPPAATVAPPASSAHQLN
jgi:hypothetical protein